MTVNYSPVVAKEWKSYFFMLFGLIYPSLVKHFRTNMRTYLIIILSHLSWI